MENIAGITTYAELVEALGYAFHPDTRGADYLHLPHGLHPWMVDAIVDAEFAKGGDPYIVALAILDGGE